MSLKPSDLQIPPPENGAQFENLCLDLYKAKFGDKTQKNGRQGQTQNGVDIFVPDQSIGIQCKKRDYKSNITKKELREEVKKAKNFKPALKRFILATTCKRSAPIQETARLISKEQEKQNLFSVEIHSWEEIKDLLSKYPKVYQKYYYSANPATLPIINSTVISSFQSESRHQELNKIRDLINDHQPKTALRLLNEFEQEKWPQLEDKEKYRFLTTKAKVNMQIQQHLQASELFIKALQFKTGDENANANVAMAWLIRNNIKKSKEFINKVKDLNPLNILVHILDIQIKDKEKVALAEIICFLPEELKTKYQIVHILAHISLKRNQYPEAEKWLKIFYNKITSDEIQKNIMIQEEYANLFLALLLAKPDVFSGRRVPDNLKTKLNEIIKIYERLVTDSNELQQFNPNWYLHYSLALELSGDLDKAIRVIQTGIDAFPKDEYLKLELSRLFRQNEDITKSIDILEKHLGLHSSPSVDNTLVNTGNKKFDWLHSALSNSADTGHNMSEKPVTLALMLTDLYIYNKQNDKALELLNQIIKNPSIEEQDRLEAKQCLTLLLIGVKKIEEAEKELNSFFEKNRDDMFTLILKSKIESAKAKTKASEGKIEESKKQENISIQHLKKAYNVFQNKNYNEENSSSSYFENREWLRDIQQISQELGLSKMYKEVEPLLEKIINQNLNHPWVFKLLYVYFENGKNRQAIKLAEALRKKFPNRIDPAEALVLIYESLGDRDKAISIYENFIKANPDNSVIKTELVLAYINNEQTDKAKELLKPSFDLNPLSSEQISHLSIAYMRTGNIKKALEIQYQNIKKHPGELGPQHLYFSFFMYLGKPKLSDFERPFDFDPEPSGKNKVSDISFLRPSKVGVDCYVRIKDKESLEEQEIPIEKDAEIYIPEHELSKALLGKKAGDIVDIESPFGNNKQYQIIEIKSKYVHQFHKIGKEAEAKFASKSFLRSATVPKKPDIKEFTKIFKQFTPDISKQKEDLNRVFQCYKEGGVTIGAMANGFGGHPVKIIHQLIFSTENKFISAFRERKESQKIFHQLDNKPDILIDLSSLLFLHWIKMEEYLEKSQFNLYVCPSTIGSLKAYGEEMALHSKDGSLTTLIDEQGELKKNFVPAEPIKQDLKFCVKVKTWAETHCQKKVISPDVTLPLEKKIKWQKVIGKEFFDPVMALYNEKQTVFLSEDAILRRWVGDIHQEINQTDFELRKPVNDPSVTELSKGSEILQKNSINSFEKPQKEHFVSSIRIFELIDYFEKRAIVTESEALKFKAELVKFNQTYIPIDHKILLFLLRESEYSANNIFFQRGLFFLSPVSDFLGVINVLANFLIEICQDPALLPYRKQMIANELLDNVSFGREENPRQIAYQVMQLVQFKAQVLPLLQNEIRSYIRQWLAGKIY